MNISFSFFIKKLIYSSFIVSSLLLLQSCSNPMAPATPSAVPDNFRPGESSSSSSDINSAPVASNGSLNVNFNALTSGTLVATDANSDPLTFSVVTNPAHGTVTIINTATGSFTYTPDTNYSGLDSFTFKANDS